MKRHLLTLAFAGALAAHASAILNFNLTINELSTTPGTNVVFSGTVTGVSGDLTLAASSVGSAFKSTGGTGLSGAFTTDFQNYLNQTTTANYSGTIFEAFVPAGTAAGTYDTNAALTNGAQVVVGGTNLNGDTVQDNEFYAVDVQAVPEPATMAGLGLGALALLRRRKRA
jgi:hypothetical protein